MGMGGTRARSRGTGRFQRSPTHRRLLRMRSRLHAQFCSSPPQRWQPIGQQGYWVMSLVCQGAPTQPPFGLAVERQTPYPPYARLYTSADGAAGSTCFALASLACTCQRVPALLACYYSAAGLTFANTSAWSTVEVMPKRLHFLSPTDGWMAADRGV